MKRITITAAVLCVLFAFSGCGAEDNGRNVNNQTTVSDILASGIESYSNEDAGEAAQSIPTIADYPNEEDIAPASEEGIDVDLTTQSSTVVYSMVYDMMSTPEKYLRKTVKMKGVAASNVDEQTGKTYYACIIKDAAACCAQGIEYVLGDESVYPQDGEEVTVIGEFSIYTEGQFRYSTLRGARLVG